MTKRNSCPCGERLVSTGHLNMRTKLETFAVLLKPMHQTTGIPSGRNIVFTLMKIWQHILEVRRARSAIAPA
eukprot:946605-Pyramimonas_sp.AAC.1